MRRHLAFGLAFGAFVFVVFGAAPAAAQSGRVVLAVNGFQQSGMDTLSTTTAFAANAENGSITTTFPLKTGTGFDGSITVRVRGVFGISLGGTSFKTSGSADVAAKVPHPFFFNQPRSIAGTVGMNREETTARLALALSSAPGGRFQFTAYAGPAYVTVKQDLVDSVSYTDSYPYDTATFTRANTSQPSKTAVGFAAGIDAAFFPTKSIGLGLSASMVGATINVTGTDNATIRIKAGGTQLGGGLRIRF